MKTIRSFARTYFAAFGLISLPFIILFISSYWILVNSEVIVYGLTFSFLSSFAIAHNFRQYEKSVTFTLRDHLNSSEFAPAEERMTEISVQMPEED